MCWSPTADLVAGSVVGGVGILALSRVRRPRQVPLACLPLILGAHQLVESVVWRGADGTVSASAAHTAILIWAAIAFPLLPGYVPLAVLSAVWPDHAARRRLLPLCAIGLASSSALAYSMASGPVNAVPMGHVLTYSVQIPAGGVVIAGYLLAGLGAPMASGNRELRAFGVIGVVGAAVCVLAWHLAFASTWCAFAAVISVTLVYWLWRDRAADDARGIGRGHDASGADLALTAGESDVTEQSEPHDVDAANPQPPARPTRPSAP
ncbi:MAG TPA: DUF6629 family protein [Actinocrinis sp.]|nr:DUF6629 family protein [Actinocrinis sp.]